MALLGARIWWALVLVCLVAQSPARAIDASDLPWDDVQSGLREELKTLKGEWSDSGTWPGTLCDGRYSYLFRISGQVAKLDLNLTDKGTVEIDTEIRDVKTYGEAKYKASTTLCIPTSGWLGVASDWARVKAELSFPDDNKDIKNINILIKSTELGHLHLGKYVPTALEDYVTRQANKGLATVWRTRIGVYLNKIITEIVRKKFPAELQGEDSLEVRRELAQN